MLFGSRNGKCRFIESYIVTLHEEYCASVVPDRCLHVLDFLSAFHRHGFYGKHPFWKARTWVATICLHPKNSIPPVLRSLWCIVLVRSSEAPGDVCTFIFCGQERGGVWKRATEAMLPFGVIGMATWSDQTWHCQPASTLLRFQLQRAFNGFGTICSFDTWWFPKIWVPPNHPI